jgi:DNA-binding transcriptional regulator YhcF (GntR family)
MYSTTKSSQNNSQNCNPQEIIQSMTATDWKILDELLYLEGLRKKRCPGQTVYTTPGTTYLAGKCGVNRWTISRATQRLVSLGVLHKQFRRAVNGVYQTCLYRISAKISWRINRVKQLISGCTSRVRKFARKQAKAVEIANTQVAALPKGGQSPPSRTAAFENMRAALGK